MSTFLSVLEEKCHRNRQISVNIKHVSFHFSIQLVVCGSRALTACPSVFFLNCMCVSQFSLWVNGIQSLGLIWMCNPHFSLYFYLRLFMYTWLCVCSDLSLGNSCSGVELITEWVCFVFFGGGEKNYPSYPNPPPPPSSLTRCCITGLPPNDRVLLSSLWNPCHIPFRRTAQQQRSLHVVEQIGKRHRQNCGGKRPQFVPSRSC